MCVHLLFLAEPLEVRLETLSNHSVAIYWKKPKTTQQLATAYVVEWFPEGHKLEELRWIRLGTNDSRALITGGPGRVSV